MVHTTEDTIAAIATPLGEGAISIIRVSGPNAISCVSKKFNGKNDLLNVKSHTANFGQIQNTFGDLVDEVICLVFKAPNSYTGEDIVEICCHGGMHVTKKVFESILSDDVRPAKPGEFTFRAFLNGKMDLSQAEAVADLISAQSERGLRVSLRQLEGELSNKIFSLREQLIKATGLLELELDFAEEGIELISREKVGIFIREGFEEIEKLLASYSYGKVWKDGATIVLVGTPNTGKSSLMNAILKEERAIVTDIPGTTRDFIEEKYIHDGVLYRLIDTAGLRTTNNPIEIEGIKRTWDVIKRSDIIIFVHDSTKKLSEEENDLIAEIKICTQNRIPLILAYNKSDLIGNKKGRNLKSVISTSARDLSGVENLVKEVADLIPNVSFQDSGESITITNQRHYSALKKVKDQLLSAHDSLIKAKSEEFIAFDLRGAIESIGEIVGMTTTEDILNEIFSKFCIGK